MSPEGGSPPVLPVPVRETLDEFSSHLDLDLHVWSLGEDGRRTAQVYPVLENGVPDGIREPLPDSLLRSLSPKSGPALQLEICSSDGLAVESVASFVQAEVERVLDLMQEVDFSPASCRSGMRKSTCCIRLARRSVQSSFSRKPPRKS